MDNSLWNYPWFDSYEFVLTPPLIQQASAVQSQQALVILSPAGWIRAAPPDSPASGRRVAAAVQTAAHYRYDQRRMAQVVRRLFETLVGGDIFVKTELVCNRQAALGGEFQPVMTAQKRTEHSKAPRTGCGAGAGHMPNPQRDKFMPMPAGGPRMRHKCSGKRTDTALKAEFD